MASQDRLQEGQIASFMVNGIAHLLQVLECGLPINAAPGRPANQLRAGSLWAAMAGAGSTAIEQEWLYGSGKAGQARRICLQGSGIISRSDRHRQREAQDACQPCNKR